MISSDYVRVTVGARKFGHQLRKLIEHRKLIVQTRVRMPRPRFRPGRSRRLRSAIEILRKFDKN